MSTDKKISEKRRSDKKLSALKKLAHQLSEISGQIQNLEAKNKKMIAALHPEFKQSGANFLHYLALRRFNLKDLQLELARYGFSSLGRCESYVMSNVHQVLERISDSLSARQAKPVQGSEKRQSTKVLDWFDAEKILHRHAQDLFGRKPTNRHVYIMVTAPSRAEFSKEWVHSIFKAGANLIRINCAHDTERDWSQMVKIIRQSEKALGHSCRILMDLGGPKIRTATTIKKKLSVGDQFVLVDKDMGSKKEVLCSFPDILQFVKINERVLFDDGKIETQVIQKLKNKLVLEVHRVPASGTKLKVEKGINFPDSHLQVAEITKKDLQDLDFAAKSADLIGLSFVQSTAAIRKIRKEIKKRTKNSVGIILKIETQAGFNALPQLLIEVMKSYPCGVMIARGDLGVEVGFERMVEIQEEILWLCEAAHVPVIWATQVLEGAVKVGQPTRAEVTDAAAAVKAECVMLNKGPFIVNAVQSLDNILKRMEFHTYKKRNLYRQLSVAQFSEFNFEKENIF